MPPPASKPQQVEVPDPVAYGVEAPARLLSARFAPRDRSTWDRHVHPDHHELLWQCRGTLTVETHTGVFAVPPMLAIWITAGVEHRVTSAPGASFHCTFFDRSLPSPVTADIAAVDIPGAAQALIQLLCVQELPTSRPNVHTRHQAEQVVAGLLRPIQIAPPSILLPADPLLRRVAQGILDDPAERCTLERWGERVGASARTLARGFVAETGMSFGRWRTEVRMRLALPRLAAGEPVAAIARAMGYRSSSAFVRVFRREVGTTPGAWRHESHRPNQLSA